MRVFGLIVLADHLLDIFGTQIKGITRCHKGDLLRLFHADQELETLIDHHAAILGVQVLALLAGIVIEVSAFLLRVRVLRHQSEFPVKKALLKLAVVQCGNHGALLRVVRGQDAVDQHGVPLADKLCTVNHGAVAQQAVSDGYTGKMDALALVALGLNRLAEGRELQSCECHISYSCSIVICLPRSMAAAK